MKKIDTFWAAIDLNLDCNRNCYFCCNRKEDELVQEIGRQVYTPHMIDLALYKLKFVIEKYNGKRLCFPILGGEPLLYPRLPPLLQDRARAILPCEVDIWLYTNGDFLTKEIMDEYSKRRIWVTLSLADSKITEVLDKIAFLKQYYRIPRLSITLSTENLLRLEALIDASLNMRFAIRFRHLYDVTLEPELAKLYAEIMPKMLCKYLEAPFLTANNLAVTYEDAIPGWNEIKSPYVCGRSFFHFCSNGNIRTCSGDPNSWVLGSIFEKEEMDLYERLRQAVEIGNSGRWSAKDIGECQGCQVYGVCQGGCPMTRKCFHGVFNKPSPYCDGLRECHQILQKHMGDIDVTI